jgi:NAD(P)-dependent dehydrogenase (short-subunit alcohol dehydrogenase family)
MAVMMAIQDFEESEKMRFERKVAIVTGGNSGIGKEVARRFVAEGGRVVVNGRNAAKTEAASKEIDPSGERAVAHVGDIALPSTGRALVKAAVDRFGQLDVLFNNAGIFGPKTQMLVTYKSVAGGYFSL